MVFGAYTLLSVWQFNQWCSHSPAGLSRCYEVRDPGQLAVLAAREQARGGATDPQA